MFPRLMIVSEAYGKNFYGVAQVLQRLVTCCKNDCLPCKVIVTKVGEASEEDKKGIAIVPTYSASGLFRWHPDQESFFDQQISDFNPDVIHIHGVFTFVQRTAVRAAKKRGVPVVLSSHGMLESWLWRQKGIINHWLKRSYWELLLKPSLKRVDYIHAITDQEAETLKREFPGIGQINISNAIDISEYDDSQGSPAVDRYLLFIGRLHPKKGVDLLIKAFYQLEMKGVRLIIAGPNFDASYTMEMKQLVKKLNLLERVSFVGPVHGEKKNKLLCESWCTVIPSYSDVVALVNLESAASFTPTITTTMTGLSDWKDSGGLLVEPKLEQLIKAMNTACHWTPEERKQKGKQAREFTEQRYSWNVIGEEWIEAYNMIAKSGKTHE